MVVGVTRVRPLEVRALVPLLEQDWDSAEQLAAALIEALDEARASRTSWIAVMQFPVGNGSQGWWYSGIGPYPGRKSAEKAVKGHPGASLAHRVAVVPLQSPEGLRRQISEIDQKRSA